MGSVTGDEQPAVTPLVGQLRAEGVDGAALDLKSLRTQQPLAHPLDGLGGDDLLEVIPGQDLELHPGPSTGHPRPQPWPRMVTEEDHGPFHRGLPGQQAVHHQPGIVRAQPFVGAADEWTHL